MKCKKEQNLKNCNCTYPGCSHKGICCDCHKRKHGDWPLEFSDYTKDKQGNLTPNVGPMKFRKGKK